MIVNEVAHSAQSLQILKKAMIINNKKKNPVKNTNSIRAKSKEPTSVYESRNIDSNTNSNREDYEKLTLDFSSRIKYSGGPVEWVVISHL